MKNKNFYNIDKNAHYFAPMSFFYPNVDHDGFVECEIIEDIFAVDDNFKITLKPVSAKYTSTNYSFWQRDFVSLIEDGTIRIVD